MYGPEGSHQQYGGAVGIGYKVMMSLQGIGIYLRHYQGYIRLVTEGTGVVYDHASHLCCSTSEGLGGRSAGKEGRITVPEGKSLTIEEGVTVIFNKAGVGVNHVAIEFSVDGSLYCLGSESAPVTLTVDGAESIEEDKKMDGYWGGIVAGESCEEMLIDHTIIEYTGGQVVEGSPAAENEYYTAGDDAYPQITTNNINGRYVITNCIIRNGWSDGIYMMGGNGIIANNTFPFFSKSYAYRLRPGLNEGASSNFSFFRIVSSGRLEAKTR